MSRDFIFLAPVAFVNVEEGIERNSESVGSNSKENVLEAQIVVKIVEDFIKKGDLTAKQIGVISVSIT